MIPVGYMYKTVINKPDWLQANQVEDIYSVSDCISKDFMDDWVNEWKHNGYWLFNSPQDIYDIANKHHISLDNMVLFFYTSYEFEWDDVACCWRSVEVVPSLVTDIVIPKEYTLQGYDIITSYSNNIVGCSPLSCNGFSNVLTVNKHCLFNSFEEAKKSLVEGDFDDSEPGPMRIFAVYTVEK